MKPKTNQAEWEYFKTMNYKYYLLLLISNFTFGQATDYWNNSGQPFKQQFRFQYENDFFAHSDQYYTQGIVANYKHSVRTESGLTHLFFKLPNAHKAAGIGIEHQAYTPSSLAGDSVLVGDFPYSAAIRLNFQFETTDTVKHRSLSWMLSTGIIGPGAQGKQMQTAIHRATNNFIPLGWQHQVSNGLLADLGINFRQRILGFRNWFNLDGQFLGTLGTGRTDASIGARLALTAGKRAIKATAYFNQAVRFVAYDASLQGALFGQRSEYTIPASQISRAVSEQEMGFRLQLNHFSLEGWYRFQTRVFITAQNHSWGGVRLGWTIK